MITVHEAEKIILDVAKLSSERSVKLEHALGAVLREDIFADRDQPPFNKSLMDGVAIPFVAYQKGTREFMVKGVQGAGQAPVLKSIQDKDCVEIMTGAVVPEGLDCVIPIEHVHVTNRIAKLSLETPMERMQNIRLQAADYLKGAVLLQKGMALGPAQIGVLASVGKKTVKVARKPEVAIITTGDEIVDIKKEIKPYQIRKSNSYTLKAILDQTRLADAQCFHIKDDVKRLTAQIKFLLRRFDILILSGGVSMGKFDFVPRVLGALGVKVLFHKVKQKPGKPFWFGKNKAGKIVFALPGSPVSTQVCAYRYVVPYLRKIAGLIDEKQPWGMLADEFHSKPDLTLFLPVKIKTNMEGMLSVTPIDLRGSGDYVALAKADGFVELPGDRRYYPKGTAAKLFTI